MRKLILVLELPEDATGEQLTDNLRFVVQTCRSALEEYKAKGIQVPVLSLKGVRAPVKATQGTDYKVFANRLLEYHLQYMPNADIPAQRGAIKRLYETGRTADELIELYNKNRAEYKLTSWFTVMSKLGKSSEPIEESDFVRSELNTEQQQALKARLSSYGSK